MGPRSGTKDQGRLFSLTRSFKGAEMPDQVRHDVRGSNTAKMGTDGILTSVLVFRKDDVRGLSSRTPIRDPLLRKP
jgi:hypothetical protein